MKALVLGGTGHIGNAVVRELLYRGYEVSAAGRRTTPPLNMAGLPVRYLAGNHESPSQLEEWIGGHDIVIDAAAPYPVDLVADTLPARRRTQNLIDKLLDRDVRFAYVSSFTTLKKWSADISSFTARIATQLHPYFELKQWMEDRVLEAARRGLPVVIVNPTMCFGPWDLHPRELCLIPRLLSGELPFFPSHYMNVLDVREVAAGLVSALEAERYARPMLFSGHSVSGEVLFRWICEIAGIAPPVWPAPAALTAFAAHFAEAFVASVGGSTPYNSLGALLVYQHEWMPPCQTFRELGVTVRPLYETLLDSVEWYRVAGYY
jgi:dihydroflavonol-4-reductase